MNRSYLILVLAIFFSLASGAVANAKPSKKEMKRAKVIFQEAEAAAAEQRYEESARKYLEAYELFPASDFLYNAAEMYRFAGDKTRAVEYYKSYLSVDSEGKGAAEARVVLATLERELAEQRRLAKEKEEDRKRREAAVAAADKGAASSQVEAKPIPKPSNNVDGDSGQPLRIAGLAGVGVGVVLVGFGGYYGIKTRRISREVSASNEFNPTLEARGESAEKRAFLFSGIGAAALIGGAVLYFISGKDSGENSSVSFAPAVGGDTVGAMAFGNF